MTRAPQLTDRVRVQKPGEDSYTGTVYGFAHGVPSIDVWSDGGALHINIDTKFVTVLGKRQ